MPPERIFLYHITHFDNLQAIVQADGLVAHNELNTAHIDIAHQSIQDRRNTTFVPYPPHGVLHDYVPFYFCNRSPMLYAIHKNNIETYQGGQENIVYLVTDLTRVQQSDIRFVFTDGHAIMMFSEFYSQVSDLDKVDWQLMQAAYWFDTDEDPDRKRRRQAEFLLYQRCPWSLITGIATFNETMKIQVEKLFSEQHSEQSPRVIVKREWYY
jgi:ssDNA thymidine ADP-ribosyltransferase, DarT